MSVNRVCHVSLFFLTILLLVPLGCRQPTEAEIASAKVQKVRDNPEMPDFEAIQLLAEAYFKTDAVRMDESNRVVIEARAANLSSMVDIGQDLGDAKQRAKRGTLFFFLQQLRKFTQSISNRQFDAMDITIQTAVNQGDGVNWVPTYQFVLEKQKMADFEMLFDKMDTAFGQPNQDFDRIFDASFPRLEKIWDVKLDAFDEFVYQRN
ncbi:hypothetical protein [Stieleria varia]|uniref:Uncharacterized protein n=1 Tax=Stieleria varia TaxID=2528005 RepID=A0A5C5ZY05_9BACT|nr:hypothetical protein [Stieleria varia]TWT92040.1 hypothetical protein Pla52n_63360 [Stieleria varia]